jgi:putative membrane protein insertion efficiency factor
MLKTNKYLLAFFFFFLKQILCAQNEDNNYTDYIKFYQLHISHIRGGDCQMYPSCSNYGLVVFKNYNPYKAMTLTSDRVMRCSHDFKNYNLTLINNSFKLIDLPDNSDSLMRIISFKKETTTYPVQNDTCELGLVRFLMLEKNYREALLEINRMLFKNYNCNEIYINYIRCKRSLNENEDAIFKFENSFPKELLNKPEFNLEIGNCYLDLGEYSIAIDKFKKALNSNDSSIIDKANIQIGLSLASMNLFGESLKYFNSISRFSPYYYNSRKIISIIESCKIEHKNPFLAGFLSTIPGLGYLYSGHKSSAASSLILNSLLAYAFYTNVKTGNYGMASLVGVFSFSFYIGNISGSIKSAKRFNNAQNYNKLHEIKSNISY